MKRSADKSYREEERSGDMNTLAVPHEGPGWVPGKALIRSMGNLVTQ